MSTQKVKAIEYVCDGCGHTEVKAIDDEPAHGYHGTVSRISSFGGTGRVEWYACTEECIPKAAVEALRRAMEGGRA